MVGYQRMNTARKLKCHRCFCFLIGPYPRVNIFKIYKFFQMCLFPLQLRAPMSLQSWFTSGFPRVVITFSVILVV